MNVRSIITLLVLSFSTWAGTIQHDEQFITAVQSMGKSDKLVVMMYTMDDCPECAYMKTKVFHDKTVEPYLMQNFVVIEKNVHKSTLPDGYDYFGIPTLFFIDKAGKKKETIVGSKRAQPFLKELQRIRGIK